MKLEYQNSKLHSNSSYSKIEEHLNKKIRELQKQLEQIKRSKLKLKKQSNQNSQDKDRIKELQKQCQQMIRKNDHSQKQIVNLQELYKIQKQKNKDLSIKVKELQERKSLQKKQHQQKIKDLQERKESQNKHHEQKIKELQTIIQKNQKKQSQKKLVLNDIISSQQNDYHSFSTLNLASTSQKSQTWDSNDLTKNKVQLQEFGQMLSQIPSIKQKKYSTILNEQFYSNSSSNNQIKDKFFAQISQSAIEKKTQSNSDCKSILDFNMNQNDQKQSQKQQNQQQDLVCARCGVQYSPEQNTKQKTCFYHSGQLINIEDLNNPQIQEDTPVRQLEILQQIIKTIQKTQKTLFVYTCCGKNILQKGQKRGYHITKEQYEKQKIKNRKQNLYRAEIVIQKILKRYSNMRMSQDRYINHNHNQNHNYFEDHNRSYNYIPSR